MPIHKTHANINPGPDFLNRFTTLPFVIDLLSRQQLTLLNPAVWEDYNDRVTMELYQKKKGAKSIYALCLTDQRETIHHWNAFANGSSGCCIEFNTKILVRNLKKVPGVIHGKTQYVKLNDLSKTGNDTERLPYLKREPFNPESEYRIIALSDQPQQTTFDVPIDINAIRRITISNKLPKSVFESLEDCLYKTCPDFKGRISHSTLFNNSRWVNYFANKNNKT